MQHQLTTWYFDNRSDTRAIQTAQIPGTRDENRCKTTGVARGDVRAWNWLMHYIHSLVNAVPVVQVIAVVRAGVGLAVDVTAHLWVYCRVSFLVLLLWFEWHGDQTSGWEGLGVVGVWRDSCVGQCLRVAMVVLPSVECGWCLLWPWRLWFWVLVLCLFRGLGRG